MRVTYILEVDEPIRVVEIETHSLSKAREIMYSKVEAVRLVKVTREVIESKPHA